jgi:hypothetical protein
MTAKRKTRARRPSKKGTFSAEAKKANASFLAFKKKRPEPVAEKNMTPLQRRMQYSGPF